jgi:biotin transport system substrate-specific component
MTPTMTPFASVKSESFATRWMLASVLTGVTCVCAQISAPLPFTPVPVTMQVFAVLLSGLLLGRRWGTVAQLQYLLLGALGLPIFALGHSGMGTLLGLTGGYLLSYPVAAGMTGWFSRRWPSAKGQLAGCVVGLMIVYGLGCLWLGLMSQPVLTPRAALVMGVGWFLAWDGLKALMAIAVAGGLKMRFKSEMSGL